ncbi:hypothetical protein GQ457_14G011530 [Hibiscus cannabinus]
MTVVVTPPRPSQMKPLRRLRRKPLQTLKAFYPKLEGTLFTRENESKQEIPHKPLVTVGDVLEPLEHFNILFLQFWSLGYRFLCLGIDTQVQYRYPKWSLELGYRYQAHNRRLRNILNQSDNRICADCGAPDPRWASTNIGVFICKQCCGVHRSLGTHVSKVLSVAMDEWTMEEIDAMAEVGGNSAANAIYEAYIPEGYSKPGPDATLEERHKFIKSKYEAREFFKKGLQISSPAFKSIFSTKFMDSFRLRPPDGMVEFIGLLKVTVLRGANLAVRDMMTSDPYVVLTLGQQTIQTGVVPSSLNPIWNEDVMLSVPRNYGPLKLVSSSYIWNKDIDIQPLISAGMAYPNPETYGNMQIGKWSKTEDNALITDSIINIVDGKVKQYVQLKLQNVECGEMYLDVEWLPLEL